MDHTYTFDIMLFFQNKKGFFHVTFMFYFFHILIYLAYDFFFKLNVNSGDFLY